MMQYSLIDDQDHILFHTRPLWEELRNKRIFITGGTGFFGKWLLLGFSYANRVLDLNATATVLSRNPRRFLEQMPQFKDCVDICFLEGDVRSFQADDHQFTHIIHAATESSTNLNDSDPLEMFDTIVAGTRHVLDFAMKNPVEKFLYVSSGAVYGKQPPEIHRVPETYLGGPNQLARFSAYAEGKRAAELLCSLYSTIPVKIARCFAFVGPFLSLDAHFAVGDFISDALSGRAVVVMGDGTPYRSYLYGADLAIWLWTILFRGRESEAYNVGSAKEIQIADLAQFVAQKVHPSPPVRILGERDPSKPCSRYVPSVDKALNELGLRDFIPLDLALDKTIAWNQSRFGNEE